MCRARFLRRSIFHTRHRFTSCNVSASAGFSKRGRHMRWRASGIEGALTATAHRLTNRGLVVRKKDVSTADRLMRRHIQLFQLLGRQLTASVVGQLISRLLQAGLTPEVEL